MKNIERIETGTWKQKPMVVDRQSVMQFVFVHCTLPSWNGRRVRDAFQLVIALAEYDAVETTDEYKSLEPAGGFVPAVPILKGGTFHEDRGAYHLLSCEPRQICQQYSRKSLVA